MRTALVTAAAAILLCQPAWSAEKRSDPAGAPAKAAAAGVVKSTAPSYADGILGRLMAWDSSLTSLKTKFTQTVVFSEAGLKETMEGTLSYLKPDRLRIEHLSPARQIIITDKKDIWIYKPSDSQAVKTRWEDWKNLQDSGFSGIMDFGNYAELADRNMVTAVPPKAPGDMVKLILSPKNRSGAYTLTLSLSATDYFPAEAELVVEGTRVHTRLYEDERNSGLDETLFEFTPPKGTEIINFKK
jgi:outer membrane lipoprotein-sorting protein